MVCPQSPSLVILLAQGCLGRGMKRVDGGGAERRVGVVVTVALVSVSVLVVLVVLAVVYQVLASVPQHHPVQVPRTHGSEQARGQSLFRLAQQQQQ